MVKAISLRVDIELSWSAASLAVSSCSESLFKALIIRGALKKALDYRTILNRIGFEFYKPIVKR